MRHKDTMKMPFLPKHSFKILTRQVNKFPKLFRWSQYVVDRYTRSISQSSHILYPLEAIELTSFLILEIVG
jgi:hypothetical protein